MGNSKYDEVTREKQAKIDPDKVLNWKIRVIEDEIRVTNTDTMALVKNDAIYYIKY
jgi:hypothetical protein